MIARWKVATTTLFFMSVLISTAWAGVFDNPLGKTLGKIIPQTVSGDETPSSASKKKGIQLDQDTSQGRVSVIEDTLCECPVAEYKLSGNLSSVFIMTSKNILGNLLSGDLSMSTGLDSAKKAAKKLNWMPIPLECRYGKAIHEEKVDQGLIIQKERCSRAYKKAYDQAEALLADVLAGFPEKHPYSFKIFITKMRGVNAEALPGGIIYISKTALRGKYRDMAAFVLSHEISHVLKRHTTKQFQATLIDSIKSVEQLKRLLTDVEPSDATIAQSVKNITSLDQALVSYQINQEHQADVCAVRLLDENKKFARTKGIAMFLEHEKEMDHGKEKKDTDHPSYPERERVLTDAVKKI